MILSDLILDEKDFFQQAKESGKNSVPPKIENDPNLNIKNTTKQFRIVTRRRGEVYSTIILDLSYLIDAHEGIPKDSIFAHTSTNSFDEAIENHFYALKHLKTLGY